MSSLSDLENFDFTVIDDKDEREHESDSTDGTNTGAMIAAKLRDEDALRLAVDDGGEPAEQLHLTLYFLGEVDAISDEAQERVLDAVVELAQRGGPITAELFAVSVFNPAGFTKGDGKERKACVVGGVGDPTGDLTALKGAVEEIFQGESMGFDLPEQHLPWAPHITLKYTDGTDLTEYVDRTGELVFDGIRVAFGDDVYDVPLGEDAEALATEPESEVEEISDVDADDDGELIVPNALLDLRAYVDSFRKEGKVALPGVGHNLRNYWIYGKGAAKIRWGTKGSMKRCIRNLRKYVVNPGGLCATYHKVATGEWPRGGIVPSDGEIEEFHAKHNQKSHGNWVQTGSQSLDGAQANALMSEMLQDSPWTDAQKRAIASYTGGGFEDVNDYMRGFVELDDLDAPDEVNAVVSDLNAALRPLPHGVKTLRRAPLDALGVSALEELNGAKRQNLAFTSTSIDQDVGDEFGDVLMEIDVPVGTRVAYAEPIVAQQDRVISGENELILEPGLVFEFSDVVLADDGTIRVSARVVAEEVV